MKRSPLFYASYEDIELKDFKSEDYIRDIKMSEEPAGVEPSILKEGHVRENPCAVIAGAKAPPHTNVSLFRIAPYSQPIKSGDPVEITPFGLVRYAMDRIHGEAASNPSGAVGTLEHGVWVKLDTEDPHAVRDMKVAEWSDPILAGNKVGVTAVKRAYNFDVHGADVTRRGKPAGVAVANHEGSIGEGEAKVSVKFDFGVYKQLRNMELPPEWLAGYGSPGPAEDEVELSGEELEYLREMLTSVLECSTNPDTDVIDLPGDEALMIEGLIKKLT